ncbi:hypothetical protein CRYUN_Cryun21dG0125200 [Craigia yunnanensis]
MTPPFLLGTDERTSVHLGAPQIPLGIHCRRIFGPSAPARAQFNPNSYATQVGTDFIRNHQALGVDFASVHIYVDSWISQTISDAHLQFTTSWMEAHIEDAEKYLGMPVIFSEFGVSAKDPGYNSSFRDTLISTVYKSLLNSTKKGRSGAGNLLWQLFPDGTDYTDDGCAIVLAKSPSTSKLITFIPQDSQSLTPCVLGTAVGVARRKMLWRHSSTMMICKTVYG